MDDARHLEPLIRRPAHWLHAAQLALVVSIEDPAQRNRVQLRLIACDDTAQQDAAIWARVVGAFAGRDRGAFLMPDVGDEVLVVFQNGDPSLPLVLGGLWNGDSTAPAALAPDNRLKVIRSKNGVTLTLDDSTGRERFRVETPGGQSLTLSDGPGAVRIEDSNGNTVEMKTTGIEIIATARVSISAAQVQVTAGTVSVDSAVATFSGVVQCATLITNAVVSSSYTPGAGNVW